jgi:hypothetical protein
LEDSRFQYVKVEILSPLGRRYFAEQYIVKMKNLLFVKEIIRDSEKSLRAPFPILERFLSAKFPGFLNNTVILGSNVLKKQGVANIHVKGYIIFVV